MRILSWNARGLGSTRAFNSLLSHKQDWKPDLIFLMETHCQHEKLERWKIKLGFNSKLVINSVGLSGGLCLFWTNDNVVELLTYSQDHIDVRIRLGNNKIWRFTGFYGHPVQAQRVHS